MSWGIAFGVKHTFLIQGRFQGFPGTHVAPGDHVRQRIEKCKVHGALALLQSPLMGLPRQVEQGRQGAQRSVYGHKDTQQDQQHKIEREIDAVGWPEHRDDALVVAGKKRNCHRNGKQRQKPERRSHYRPAAAVANAANVLSSRGISATFNCACTCDKLESAACVLREVGSK